MSAATAGGRRLDVGDRLDAYVFTAQEAPEWSSYMAWDDPTMQDKIPVW